MANNDTIAAVATASGRGGIGIIRISGTNTKQISQQLLGSEIPARQACFKLFKANDNSTIDSGLALYFKSPASYTGEDTLELQGHGGPVVLDMLLKRVLALGARLAEPGEFTQRAFLNNKLDLAQAEAVADIIDAGTAAAASSAQRSLQGAFSERINDLQRQLKHLRLYVESAIDFSDEDIDFLAGEELQKIISNLQQAFKTITETAKQGSLLRDGMTVVLAGKPNAGKSSLLNALSQRDTAIVTAVAGTTRDVLKEQIQIDGMPVHIIDTAGLRETSDIIEQEGVKRAKHAISQADQVLLVVDDQESSSDDYLSLLNDIPASVPVTIVFNKVDITGTQVGETTSKDGRTIIRLSAKHKDGLNLLTQHLKERMGFNSEEKNVFLARRRHLDALTRSHAFLNDGIAQLLHYQAGEMFAEDLRLAQNALSEITGKMTPDDLLGEIFSSFCIGK
ncbi:tRNA uridine-5-carboxymethylaminomethyl(34) synthesis GTPase MnmE [Cycloclasticus pugetii]|uniref:tRNA uridine-5-carboxymethylaminomethyl(34) synthesis GTPase MnmE n=1 Tax=Cycloclasticus pugetii TaxID=34068 RepID=UPI0003625614|nr:tRNA uridine-5-carboxymethylaminomethyl(34) synthesis GTPase MnmE [Cycloclasticus pugetii]